MAKLYTPIYIIDRKPDEFKAEHCEGNDQIYKLLTSTCDSLYPEFKERKLLIELRSRIEGIESDYKQRGYNADGISVLFMKTQETALYSGLLLKEVQRCINQGEQVEQLRQEAKQLRRGLQKYSRDIGCFEDIEQKSKNLGTAWQNAGAIDDIFKKYNDQKRLEMLLRMVTLGRRGRQLEQRHEL